MRKAHKIVAVVGAIVLAVAGSYAQSLGDVAREQRQKQAKDAKQAKDTPAVHKVLTNEDLPASADPVSSTSVSTDQRDNAPGLPAANDTHAADQWKAKIEAQKSSVASLQNQIEHLNSSIHFAGANCVANCVQYNEQQIKKQDEAQRMQKQLDEEKRQLEDMQESARKAGLGSSVYEP